MESINKNSIKSEFSELLNNVKRRNEFKEEGEEHGTLKYKRQKIEKLDQEVVKFDCKTADSVTG